MSQNNPFAAQIESVVQSLPVPAREDFRALAGGMVDAIAQINPNFPRPGGAPKSGQAAPAGVALSVSGANGAFNYSATVPNQNGRQVWLEISYSPVQSFTQQVTTQPVTQATSGTIPAPGETHFFRLRASFDRVNWSAYAFAGTAAVSAGLVSSAAISPGASFNQTNFAVVSSTAAGGTANLDVDGASGSGTSYPHLKGEEQEILPSAVIAGVPFGSDQFVAWDGEHYVLRPTLAAVMADGLTPIGKASVVNSGAPALPVMTPVVVNGYLVNATWTGDNGLSAPPTLTVTDPGGTGAGAVIVCTGVSGGHMDGVQVLNAGNGQYDNNTAITATGGVGAGTPGGGTAAGGNGGRLTAV